LASDLATKHLSSIPHEIELCTAILVLARVAFQLSEDEDIRLVITFALSQLITWIVYQADVQLSLADRPRDWLVWGGDTATTLRGTETVIIRRL